MRYPSTYLRIVRNSAFVGKKRKEKITRDAARRFSNLHVRQAKFNFSSRLYRVGYACTIVLLKSYLLNIDLRAAFTYLSRVVPIRDTSFYDRAI